MPAKNTEATFWGYMTPEPNSGCWLWTGAVLHGGHGTVRFNGRYWQAHRLAWTLTHGEIPGGMCVCHRCDVSGCCNPDHLWLGTRGENNLDMRAKGRESKVPFWKYRKSTEVSP
jgi:hypothetical protein